MRMLILVAAGLTLGCLLPNAASTDAVAYCKAAGNIDAPDKASTGPAVPGWMIPALYTPQEIKAQTEAGVDPARVIVWRCMGGKIWACVQGNAPICGKANQDKTPTKAMREFCAGQPNTEVIPLYVIGHENPMIYDWTCKGKQPTITADLHGRCAALPRRAVEGNRASALNALKPAPLRSPRSGGRSQRSG
jgi:hypothetical protein